MQKSIELKKAHSLLKITQPSNQPVINNVRFQYKCTNYEQRDFVSISYPDHIDLLPTNSRAYILMSQRRNI